MSEWAVVGVIITLATFFIAICKPLISLTKAITELTAAVGELKTQTKEQKAKAKESHTQLWNYNKEQDIKIEANKDKIAEHDIKIKNIEGRVNK